MKTKTRTVLCRQCLIAGCGKIFRHQQSYARHLIREHNGVKSKKGLTWDYVSVTTTVGKREAK